MNILQDSYISFVNLAHRKDRLLNMTVQLRELGIEAERFEALTPDQVYGFVHSSKLKVMENRTRGAIGCHYSQIQVMKNAFIADNHAWIMEDDLVFCDDFNERLPIIEQFLDTHEWDVFFFGGTYHLNCVWHSHPKDLKQCTCTLGKDWEPTDNERINRVYGCWGTYCYLVNIKSIPKILKFFDEHVHESMGIDWLFILMQPQLHAYCFNPGCVKQYDNKSDIGNGMTYFSGFEALGKHWYADKM